MVPAGSIRPRPKRTSDEVDAEADRLAALRADLARKSLEAVATLAALTAAQDKLAEEEENNLILTIDDDNMELDKGESGVDEGDPGAVEDEDEDDATLTITQEDFDRIEDEDAYRSANEFDAPKSKPKVKVQSPLSHLNRTDISCD